MKNYRGYKTRRHFLNAKLHALSEVICGSRTVLDEEIQKIILRRSIPPFSHTHTQYTLKPPGGVITTKMLTDKEAKEIYKKLLPISKQVMANRIKTQELLGFSNKMTDMQRRALIKISKYKLSWKPEALFSYICETFPELRKKMSIWEIKNSKLYKLYSIMSKQQASKIIKRLDKIQKRDISINQK